MKSRIITAAVLIIFSVLVCITTFFHSAGSVEKICDDMEKLRVQISRGQPEAYRTAELICDKWDKQEKVMMLYMAHNELEEVGLMIDILPEMINSMNKSNTEDELFYHCEKIIAQIKHLLTIESLSLQNVL